MESLGILDRIWRYPVKSLAAEPLACSAVELHGLPGDRAGALFVRSGHARTGKPYRGKEHERLHTTASVRSASELAAARGVHVDYRTGGSPYFDCAPVSLLVDRWVGEVERHVGRALDPLRWRPNVYVRAGGERPFGESDLVGRELQLGTVRLRVREPIGRCVTTTYDAAGERDDEVLAYVARCRANVMGVYCDVLEAGSVRLGDVLRLRAR